MTVAKLLLLGTTKPRILWPIGIRKVLNLPAHGADDSSILCLRIVTAPRYGLLAMQNFSMVERVGAEK